MKNNVIDLFAGCGGLTDGFLQTGKYKTLAAVDWELPTVNTLKERLKTKYGYDLNKKNIIHFDIQRTDELINGFNDSKYGTSIGIKNIIGDEQVDLIVGGPPCQAYSIAGRVRDENGMHDDYRNYLFESYIKIVNQFKPKAFVFENVEGILSAKPGGISIVKRITEGFAEIGYEITSDLRKNAVFDTSYFGVPQKRKRVIIFGVPKSIDSKKTIRQFYAKMNLKKQAKPTNAGIAFENIPKIFPTESDSKVSHKIKLNGAPHLKNHEPRFHSKRDIDIFRTLANDIKTGQHKYISSQSLIDLYKERTGKDTNVHKYHVIREDKPGNTIPAHLYKDGLRHIHPDPEQARSITVREAARIQSFPDDFEFFGSKGDQYKMIGNAVPPSFAKVIAETVDEIINNTENLDYIRTGLFKNEISEINEHALYSKP
jgi:DNA (cytosine-5)-methyltransferase 1